MSKRKSQFGVPSANVKKKNQGGEKRGSEGQENREAAGLKIREKKAYAIYGL